MRQYARFSDSSARLASSASSGPSNDDRELAADRLLHAIVQLQLAAPPIERRGGVRPFGPERDQRVVDADGAGEIALAAQHLTEHLARVRERRIDRQGALERRSRVRVAALEIRGDAGAEVQARILRIGRERVPKGFGRPMARRPPRWPRSRRAREAPCADRSGPRRPRTGRR